MLRSALVAAAAVLLALAAPAGAGAAPLVPVVPGISVVNAPCPVPDAYYSTRAGCTWVGATSVYVADAGNLAVTYHELGHQFAFRVLGDTATGPLTGAMLKFARVTRPRAWGSGARSLFDVREQFADAYAACALGERPEPNGWGDDGGNFPTGSGYDPSPRTQRMVCAMIVRAGARQGI